MLPHMIRRKRKQGIERKWSVCCTNKGKVVLAPANKGLEHLCNGSCASGVCFRRRAFARESRTGDTKKALHVFEWSANPNVDTHVAGAGVLRDDALAVVQTEEGTSTGQLGNIWRTGIYICDDGFHKGYTGVLGLSS